MDLILKNLANLLKVKSLITVVVVVVFAVLSLQSKIPNELIATVITAVTTYYFTKKDNEIE